MNQTTGKKRKKKKKSKSISARVFPEINAPRSRFQTQPGWEPSPPRIVSSAEITQTDRVRPLQGREACDPSSITAAGTPFTRRTVGIHRPAGRPSSASPGLMAAEAGCAGRPPLAAIRGLWGPERSRQASAPGCSATAPAQRPAAVASRNAQAGESRPPEQRRSGRRAGATPRAAALAAAVQGGTRTLGRSAVVAVAAESPGPREPVPLRPSCEPEWRRRRRRLWRRRRRWRKWSGEEGVVVSVWRRRRESFLQLHFRSAFCSERERRNERERHTHRAPSPPPALPPLPPSVPTHPTPASRREGRPRRQEDWFPGPRRCPPGSSGPCSGVCECFYVGEGGGGRRSSDLSSRLVSPRLYMFPALRRRKRSRSHPPSRPGL